MTPGFFVGKRKSTARQLTQKMFSNEYTLYTNNSLAVQVSLTVAAAAAGQ
jgi:hypothetical protein